MPGRRVILLVGPKGAGKSTLGRRLVARVAGAAHVEPEVHWIAHARESAPGPDLEARGFARVARAVEEALRDHVLVVTDTTAASPHTAAFVASLRALAPVLVVHIDASEATCLARIRARDASVHLPADEARIAETRARSLDADLAVDATLDGEACDPDGMAAQLVALLDAP